MTRMFCLHNPKSKQNIYNFSKLHTMVKLCNPPGHLQEKNLECVLVAAKVILKKYLGRVQPTDKRTDVWSRDFLIWEINFGLWAVAWARLWENRVWTDYEQLLRPIFLVFRGQKIYSFYFFENTTASALKSCIEKR